MQVLWNFNNILKAPYPEVLITGFWDSAIKLNVRFWIDSKDEFFVTKSNVTETINLAFKQAWITIPFNQITLSNRDDFSLKLKK
jgi:small-conductance mechanosensitive channel